MPKSPSFTLPLAFTNMFWGLISKWTTNTSCMYVTPQKTRRERIEYMFSNQSSQTFLVSHPVSGRAHNIPTQSTTSDSFVPKEFDELCHVFVF